MSGADSPLADHALRAASFADGGALYDLYRPGFPHEVADGVLSSGELRVVDLGAGTGKLTELLARDRNVVTAVDPSESMLAILRGKSLPGVTAVRGSAERLPLPDASQDVVTAAQAFHWFERNAACAEMSRVLVPQGHLMLTWNGASPRSAWDARCAEVANGQSAPPGDEWPDLGAQAQGVADTLGRLPGFSLESARTIEWAEDIAPAHYRSRWRTVSNYLVASSQERTRMEATIDAILTETFGTALPSVLPLWHRTDVLVYRSDDA